MAVDSIGSSAASTTPSTSPSGTNALGRDAFMKLLVTELQNQDPTKPKDDTQFIAELAQFSSLEELTSLNQTVASISQMLSTVFSSASTLAQSANATNGV